MAVDCTYYIESLDMEIFSRLTKISQNSDCKTPFSGSLANALSEVHVVGQVTSDVAKITACNDANNRIAINVSVNSDYLSGADGWQDDGQNWTRVSTPKVGFN